MAAPTLRAVWQDPFARFLLAGATLYLTWQLAYALALHPHGGLDRAVIDSLVVLSGGLLQLVGFELIPEPANAEQIRTVGVQGGSLLWIGDNCNGLSLFVVYLIFIFAYPGPVRHKLWFAVLGLLSIHFINVLRIAVLVVLARHNYAWVDFNHDYTFYVVVYGWVFLLWYIWVTRLGPPLRRNTAA
ncbi:MAG: archaeosortase/exosortase family protein [Flavobacteriales bacterium]|nr:archaeosortase/exosortase family protein [Flavobacteriales bacterium]